MFRSFLPNLGVVVAPASRGPTCDNRLLEAVRGLHLAHPELGPKPLLAKLSPAAAAAARAAR